MKSKDPFSFFMTQELVKKIAFDWRVKLFLEKVVSFIPFGYDYKIYSYFGRKFLGLEKSNPIKRIEKGLDNLELIKKKTNFEYENATILELGTGLNGVDILLFYILGCGKIITLDHIVHLKRELMISVIQSLSEKLENISIRFNQDIERLEDRLYRINKNGSLDELLTSCNIFAYDGIIPDVNIIGGKSVDLLYSESCLQRIPIRHLQRIFKILPDILSENAISFHRLDTKDFNTIYFKNVWGLNYLKYSDFLWSLMTAEKFNNQNRLREYEFISLLETSRLNTLYIESFIKRDDVLKLKSFPLAKRFQEVSLEEIAIVASKIISTKSHVKNPKRKYIYL